MGTNTNLPKEKTNRIVLFADLRDSTDILMIRITRLGNASTRRPESSLFQNSTMPVFWCRTGFLHLPRRSSIPTRGFLRALSTGSC